MHKLFLLCLFPLLSTYSLQAIGSYQKGDILNNWAKAGLNLRKDRNISADVVLTIPFGEQVIALEFKDPLYPENTNLEVPYSLFDGKIQNITLKGKWLRVSYREITGYVFDGFLSKFPTPVLKDKTTIKDPLRHYLQEEIGVLRSSSNHCRESKIIYREGIYLKYQERESSYDFRIILPDISLIEAFQLVYHLDIWGITAIEQNEDKIWVHFGCGSYQFTTTQNVVIITGGFGC